MARSREKAGAARWALQDAKNKFSKVVDAALRGQPQVVTRRGVNTAVLIAYDEYESMVNTRAGKRLPLSQYLLGGIAASATDPFERVNLRSRNEV